jgi:hypothetical protein
MQKIRDVLGQVTTHAWTALESGSDFTVSASGMAVLGQEGFETTGSLRGRAGSRVDSSMGDLCEAGVGLVEESVGYVSSDTHFLFFLSARHMKHGPLRRAVP